MNKRKILMNSLFKALQFLCLNIIIDISLYKIYPNTQINFIIGQLIATSAGVYFLFLSDCKEIQSQCNLVLKNLKLTSEEDFEIETFSQSFSHFNPIMKTAADAIKNYRLIFNQIIEPLPVAIIAVNENQKVLLCNKAAKELSLCKREENNTSIYLYKMLENTIKNKKAVSNHDYRCNIGGEDKRLLINTQTIKNINDSLTGALLIAYDYTEYQHMMEQVQQSEKLTMINELAAGLAHEIKNPLTTARGLIQLIAVYEKKNPKTQQHFSVAINELDNINFIINELMLLSQPEEPDLEFKQLNQLIDEVSLLIEGEAINQNVVIEKEYPNDLPLLAINSRKLKKVFLNLALNGLNAMENEGKLKISVKHKATKNEFAISFEDSGKGLSEDEIKKIFNPFYTTSAVRIGLGLTISYQLICSLGGRITVESKKNIGSIFTVFLPEVKYLDK